MVIPNHVAIILDGNGRWAKKKGMPRTYGHVKGCENLEKICSVAKELGVKYLTVYAFSTENWKRSKEEVDALMKLFRNYMKKCIKISRDNKMQVRVIGDPTAFDPDLQEKIKDLGCETEVIDYYPRRLTMYGMLKRIKNKGERFNKNFFIRNIIRS